jgi:hypothetical protein
MFLAKITGKQIVKHEHILCEGCGSICCHTLFMFYKLFTSDFSYEHECSLMMTCNMSKHVGAMKV